MVQSTEPFLLLHSLPCLQLAQAQEFLRGDTPVPIGIDPPEFLRDEREPARLVLRKKSVAIDVGGAEFRQSPCVRPVEIRVARTWPLRPLARRTIPVGPVVPRSRWHF